MSSSISDFVLQLKEERRLEDVLIVCRERGVHPPLVLFLRQQLHDDSEKKVHLE
jgi:hypothetical protein